MQRLLRALMLTTGLLAYSISYAQAPPVGDLEVDIDTHSCEISIGAFSEEFEDGTDGTVVQAIFNQNWIVGSCHVQLDEDQVVLLGGPFQRTHVFSDFDCKVEIEDESPDDLLADRSHAVLTPSGNLEIECVVKMPD